MGCSCPRRQGCKCDSLIKAKLTEACTECPLRWVVLEILISERQLLFEIKRKMKREEQRIYL